MKIRRLNQEIVARNTEREIKKKKKKYFKKRKNKKRVCLGGEVNGFSPLRLRGTNGNSSKWCNATGEKEQRKGVVVEEKWIRNGIKKKNGETKGENVSWSWKIVAAIRCTGGKASRRRRSFVACGKLSLKDEEAGEEKEISACVYIGEVHRNRKLFESVRKRIWSGSSDPFNPAFEF